MDPVVAMATSARRRKSPPRSKRMEAKLARAAEVGRALSEMIPNPKCELDFATPFQLLVATILSAQTTDKGVNRVTPELFRLYPTPRALAAASQDDVERVVRPTGFF